ncbi:MAG: polysaccharide deacetylase family protein [Verrucomicrobiae bacterium]|nr:polysaccharide deacetylase family protein [Verrucomicrobiae bacterium]
MGKKPALVVSIHDVAPRFEPEVRGILARLEELGISKCSLLVVPSYHADGPITRNPRWMDLLRAWHRAGHELVLHGYHHQVDAVGSERSRGGSWFFRNYYTAGESEFLELSYARAKERLLDGLEVFRELGVKSRGFIAPAWLMNDQVLDALRDLGFGYTNTLRELIDLRSNRRWAAWSQVYSVRARWRRVVSIAWNEMLFLRNQGEPLLRISLHPPEWEHPRVWRALERLISKALNGRESLTYAGFVDREAPASLDDRRVTKRR